MAAVDLTWREFVLDLQRIGKGEGGETGILFWCWIRSSVCEFVEDGLIGRRSTLGLNKSRSNKRNVMGESENRSEEYKA
jgi:hypothetical protein